MTSIDARTLLGLPLARAKEILDSNGIKTSIIDYNSRQGRAGSDMRVIKAVVEGNQAAITVSAFVTEI